MSVRSGAERSELVAWLEAARIETRLVFGGNILRQAGFRGIRCRIHGSLERSEAILHRTLFVGVYPGLDDARIDYVAETVGAFFHRSARRAAPETRSASL